jgi:polyisoprenoid-binding protein YceI
LEVPLLSRLFAIALLVPALAASTPKPAAPAVWNIDKGHSSVNFQIRHFVSKVRGSFTDFKGTISADPDSWEHAQIDVVINAPSITTNNDRRDADLRSSNFFSVDTFPTITFKSTRIEGTRDSFKLTGLLTIRDQTREVTLDAAFNGFGRNQMGELASFSASTKLSRKDFGLAWNVALETGGVMVSDQFKVEIEIEAVKQEPTS